MPQPIVDISPWLEQGLTVTAGGGAIVALAFYFRRLIKGLGLEDAQRQTAATAAQASDAVLQNLQAEVERLSKRVAQLEGQLSSLNEKLASVRISALECYEIALTATEEGPKRDALLNHLREIIRDT